MAFNVKGKSVAKKVTRKNYFEGFFPTKDGEKVSVLIGTYFGGDALSADLGIVGGRISAFWTITIAAAKAICAQLGKSFDGKTPIEYEPKMFAVSDAHGCMVGKNEMTEANEPTVLRRFSTRITPNPVTGEIELMFSKEGIYGVVNGEDEYFLMEDNTVVLGNDNEQLEENTFDNAVTQAIFAISTTAKSVKYSWAQFEDIEAYLEETFDDAAVSSARNFFESLDPEVIGNEGNTGGDDKKEPAKEEEPKEDAEADKK